MAIEDIIQIKDTVSKDGIIPLDRNEDVMNAQNQVDFLRTQKEMGLSENAVMSKLIQMFVEQPTRFTQEFGKESADAIREFLGFETQGDMEKKGYVFDDNSSEIIGQNISFRSPEDSAIGTLTTAQSKKFDDSLRPEEQFRVLTEQQATEMGLPPNNVYQMNTITGEVRALSLPQNEQFRVLTPEQAREMGLPPNNAYQINTATGEVRELDNRKRIENDIMMEEIKKQLDFIPGTRILTEDEAESMGLSTDRGKTWKVDEETGDIILKERWLTQEEVIDRGFPYTDGQIYILDTETQEITRKEPKGIEKIILDVMDWFKYGRQDPENRDYK